MSDKVHKLEELKRESKEQQRRAEKMKEDAQRHKVEVATLEQASSSMKEGLSDLDSQNAAKAIRDLDRAKDAAHKEIDRLRTERDRLLKDNDDMTQRVKKAHQRVRAVGRQLDLIRGASKGEVARLIGEANSSLKSEWNDLTAADSTLSSARVSLQQIKFE